MLKMRLERVGDFEVLAAEDSEKGCKLALTEHPDVILMDLEMPVVDRWEPVQRLKEDPRYPDHRHVRVCAGQRAREGHCHGLRRVRCQTDRVRCSGRRHSASCHEPEIIYWPGGQDGEPLGKRTVNTDPLPGSLATVTSPPIMRASLRVMARPKPVPPKRCAVEASAWVNSSKILACCSGVMPIPLSETATSIQSRPSNSLCALSLTSPSLVNLQALLRRLNRICRRRMGSTVSEPRSSGVAAVRRFLFCSASCRAVPTTSSISGASGTV